MRLWLYAIRKEGNGALLAYFSSTYAYLFSIFRTFLDTYMVLLLAAVPLHRDVSAARGTSHQCCNIVVYYIDKIISYFPFPNNITFYSLHERAQSCQTISREAGKSSALMLSFV